MQKGQTIIILILLMSVSLAIGLSVVQKSLVDVSTSSRVEEYTRAFSAAEAGIEKALTGDTSGQNFIDSSSQILNISDTGLIPCLPGSDFCTQFAGAQQVALEYPPLSKEEVTQVWLSDFNSTVNPPSNFYTQPTIDIYWGNSTAADDRAALELTLVYFDGTAYQTKKWYLDQSAATRVPANNFDKVNCAGGYRPGLNSDPFICKVTIGSNTGTTPDPTFARNGILPSSGSMILRARLLYNKTSQPFAVQATGSGSCSGATFGGCYIPPQARIIVSTGASGQTQRRIQLFQLSKVVPPYFDFALFSIGEINK